MFFLSLVTVAYAGGYLGIAQDVLNPHFHGPPTREGAVPLPDSNDGKSYYCPNVVDTSCYTLDIVPSIALHELLVPANAANSPGLDPQFYGVWWLNNSEPTGLVTFSGLPTVNILGRPILQALSYGPGYSYDNSDSGKQNWMESFVEDFRFDIEFLTNRTAIAHPNFLVIGEVPTYFGNFTFNYIDETHMQRVSEVAGKDVPSGDYPAVRVINGNGDIEPMYWEWVNFHKHASGSDYSLIGNKRTNWDFFKACNSHCI